MFAVGAQRATPAAASATTTRAAGSCSTAARGVGGVSIRRTRTRSVAMAAMGQDLRRSGGGASLSMHPTSSVVGVVAKRRQIASPLRAIGDGEGSLLDDLDADARCPVPKDQRPASQLREVQESILIGRGVGYHSRYFAKNVC
jgi:hypothetical protein